MSRPGSPEPDRPAGAAASRSASGRWPRRSSSPVPRPGAAGEDAETTEAADADGGQQIEFAEEPASPEAGSAQTEADPAEIAASVPGDSVAVLEDYVNGAIKRGAFDRRAALVELRDPDTTGQSARSQALDELIFNRWVRAQAEESGAVPSAEQITAEVASPEFASEAERLRSVGYEEDGVQLDAEARLAAEGLFGDGAPEVDILTRGFDGSGGSAALDGLIEEMRPRTACAADVAALSPLCANGPEP